MFCVVQKASSNMNVEGGTHFWPMLLLDVLVLSGPSIKWCLLWYWHFLENALNFSGHQYTVFGFIHGRCLKRMFLNDNCLEEGPVIFCNSESWSFFFVFLVCLSSELLQFPKCQVNQLLLLSFHCTNCLLTCLRCVGNLGQSWGVFKWSVGGALPFLFLISSLLFFL